MVFRKIEIFKPKPKETVKNSIQDYVKAQVDKTELKRKIEAGREYSWVEEEEKNPTKGLDGKTPKAKTDVHDWVQMIMETTDGVRISGKLTDEATRYLCWLARRWQNAVYHNHHKLAEALEEHLMQRYAEYRLAGGIRIEQLGPEMVIPPPELNPAMNQFQKRPPASLPGT